MQDETNTQTQLSPLEWFRATFPANRVAAIGGTITALVAFLVTLQTSFVPGSPGEEAIGKGIVLVGIAYKALDIVTKFLDGSQKWDAIQAFGSEDLEAADADPATV